MDQVESPSTTSPDKSVHNSLQDDIEKYASPTAQSPPPPNKDVVTWDASDHENPHTWSLTRKWFVTIVLNTLPLFVNVGSSILSAASAAVKVEYHVSSEVTVLMTSIFLLVSYHQPSDSVGARN